MLALKRIITLKNRPQKKKKKKLVKVRVCRNYVSFLIPFSCFIRNILKETSLGQMILKMDTPTKVNNLISPDELSRFNSASEKLKHPEAKLLLFSNRFTLSSSFVLRPRLTPTDIWAVTSKPVKPPRITNTPAIIYLFIIFFPLISDGCSGHMLLQLKWEKKMCQVNKTWHLRGTTNIWRVKGWDTFRGLNSQRIILLKRLVVKSPNASGRPSFKRTHVAAQVDVFLCPTWTIFQRWEMYFSLLFLRGVVLWCFSQTSIFDWVVLFWHQSESFSFWKHCDGFGGLLFLHHFCPD